MKSILRFAVSSLLVLAFLSNALPCGPGYVSPIFVNAKAPENPYAGYAAGRLGIIAPGFRRSLLYAAYRYINGGSFTPDEQKDLVSLWRSDIDRNYTSTDDISETIKVWVDKRKVVVGKDEKTPDIYVERAYGGYDFFPNCTKNAFETAAETLSDRVSAHGPNDSGVKDWVKAQDDVFANCSSGKQSPNDPPVGSPDWLQKDRAYQKAAASFYSLDYVDAKRRFAEIAQDIDSPWRETADYLVARTLIRQASLSKSPQVSTPLYEEAEQRLRRFASGSGKFAASAQRFEGLIKYRIHPKERVGELAKILITQSGNENFRQDLTDFTWLMDKYETEALTAEAKRKSQEEAAKNGTDDNTIRRNIERALAKLQVDVTVLVNDGEVTISGNVAKDKIASIMMAANEAKPKKVVNNLNRDDSTAVQKPEDEKLQINLYSDDYAQNWTIFVKPDANDEDAVAEAAKVVGKALTEDMKKRVREMRQSAYAERFSKGVQPDYEGSYYGDDEKLTPELLPDHLRNDDLINWLFVFQMKNADSYDYSVKRYNETNADLWLLTALSKASKDSADLKRLLDAAEQANRTSPAYLTIAFHSARLYLDLGKNTEARKLIESLLSSGDDIPVSVRNQFIGLRLRLAQTLEDYLTDSLRKPYAFDFNGTAGTVEELIAERKAQYDPEYNKDGREAFEREVDESFKSEMLWKDRQMFDGDTISIMNKSFSQAVLMRIEQSPALPEYMRSRFAIAIWTRAYLLDDYATLLKITPEIAKYEPEFAQQLQVIVDAKTPTVRQTEALFFMLKNPIFSPYIEDGIGKTDNEFGQWDSNDWWCTLYTNENEDAETPSAELQVVQPKFLTAAQKQAAAAEIKKIADLGDSPQLLAKRVLAWAVRSPADNRVPEALYIMHQANGWTKYGCGNSEETQKEISVFMNKKYPQSEWTRKLTEDATEK